MDFYDHKIQKDLDFLSFLGGNRNDNVIVESLFACNMIITVLIDFVP